MTIQTIWRKHCFNSRTREGCDVCAVLDFPTINQFQFTHPGGVRLLGDEDVVADLGVSIHAPGRGATRK